MGGELSTCCGGATYKPTDKNSLEPIEQLPIQRKQTITAKDVASFIKLLEKGLEIQITLGDASRLQCTLMYAKSKKCLYLSCTIQGETRARPIAISGVTTLLSTRAEIDTLELAAGVRDDDHCVAIGIESANGCLPLFFNSDREKKLFVAFMNQAMQETENNTPL